LAPEQWRGEQVDGRADQYALAIVAFEMLTGRRPFETPNVSDLMKMHLGGEVPDINRSRPGLPPGADTAIRRALSKHASERFPTASAFVEMLAPAPTTGTGPAYRTGQRPAYRPETRPARSRPKRRWPGVVALVLLGAAAAWLASDPIARRQARGAARRTADEARSAATAFIARQTGQDLGDTASGMALDSLRRTADSLLALAADTAGSGSPLSTDSASMLGTPSSDSSAAAPGRHSIVLDTTMYGASPPPFRTVRATNGFVRVMIHGGVARARVDGTSYGYTPAVIALPPGVHFVTVEGAGDAFLPSQISITVTADDTVTAEFKSRTRAAPPTPKDSLRDSTAAPVAPAAQPPPDTTKRPPV
jgi:hypothetical protein